MNDEVQRNDNQDSAPVSNKPPTRQSKTKFILAISLLIVIGVSAFLLLKTDDSNESQSNTENNSEIQGLRLDPTKDYGDKYKDGILPVGDNQYTSSGAEKGKVYLCNAQFAPSNQAGAQTRGPWFINSTQWDINKKYSVLGEVDWEQKISNKIEGNKRLIVTNNLPDHTTGTFPVASSDPAYQYDRNPNTIKTQSLTYNLASNPSYGAPRCMGGEVGVMLTGVSLFSAFDAGGRDAGAWEIQDACEGHPQVSGLYHYHTLSSCIKDVSISTVIGFALDGFPITGPKVSEGNFLTTSDLDECHGITSEINLDNKKVTSYHYVMTQDFPYSVSCFRAEAIQPPGQHSGDSDQPSGMSPPNSSRPRP